MDTIEVVDRSRWADLEDLFGPSGAQRGCWCMFRRVPNKEYDAGAGNRAALEGLVDADEPVGLLGYAAGQPVAWCSVSPRTGYRQVLRSAKLKPDDPDNPAVWAVTCFFVRRGHRRAGLCGVLLDAAVEYARRAGAAVLEGYPVDTEDGTRKGDISAGSLRAFERAGFAVHRRTGGRHVVVRREL